MMDHAAAHLPEPSVVPTFHLDAREIDIRCLAEVDMLLDVKQKLLAGVHQMNNEAEGNLHLDEFGVASEPFQHQYALIVRNLRDCNDRLKVALVRLQQRVQMSQFAATQGSMAHFGAGGSGTGGVEMGALGAEHLAALGLGSHAHGAHAHICNNQEDIVAAARVIILDAQKTSATKLKIKKGRRKKGDKGAAGKAGGHGGNGTGGAGGGGGGGGGGNGSEEERSLHELVTSCVCFLYCLKFFSEQQYPISVVFTAIEMLMQKLGDAVKANENRTLLASLRRQVADIKNVLA